jgi:hypothetical protein
MNRPWFSACFLTIAAVGVAQVPADLQKAFERADLQIVRLSPAAFPELPRNVLAELRRRGCTIPQVPMLDGRQNVIKGEFSKPGQTDWAVLCSVNRVSSILIFWNGSAVNPTEIEKGEDMDHLQGWGNDKIVYSRAIMPVGKKYIMDHYSAYGGEKPPPIDHQGINDAFVGKASVVQYFYREEWLHLTGAD